MVTDEVMFRFMGFGESSLWKGICEDVLLTGNVFRPVVSDIASYIGPVCWQLNNAMCVFNWQFVAHSLVWDWISQVDVVSKLVYPEMKSLVNLVKN